jgi:hypothetical protein
MQKFDDAFKHGKHDILKDRFCKPDVLTTAQHLLEEDDSEEAFLGVQGVMLLNGLL